jgi:hypothetical protein
MCSQCNCIDPLTKAECSFFRWKQGSTRSPTASPTLTSMPALVGSPTLLANSPALTHTPPSTQPPPVMQPLNGNNSMVLPKVCPTPGCNQTRIHVGCSRRVCKKHCVAAGGCSVHGHTAGHAPTSSSTALTSGAPHVLPIVNLPDEPSFQVPASTQDPMSTSIDPQYVSHMAPIFTEQYQCKQEFQEETRHLEAQRKELAKISKHSIVVYAWTTVSHLLMSYNIF